MTDATYFIDAGRFRLKVYERGNPGGVPAIFLHGGPGAGSDLNKTNLFGLDKCRLFFLDQRGCGGSAPLAGDESASSDLSDNTTSNLIDDIQRVKTALNVEQPWIVVGGSFGSTLGLSYSVQFPHEVRGLFHWAIFLTRARDIDDMFQPGRKAALARPDAYARFLDHLPEADRDDPVRSYGQLFWSADKSTRERAAWQWTLWNRQLYYASPRPDPEPTDDDIAKALTMSRLVHHYFTNNAFLSEVLGTSAGNNQLLESVDQLPDVPVRLVHGDADLATPFEGAQLLHETLRAGDRKCSTSLRVVPGASHSITEPGYVDALRESFSSLLEEVNS